MSVDNHVPIKMMGVREGKLGDLVLYIKPKGRQERTFIVKPWQLQALSKEIEVLLR